MSASEHPSGQKTKQTTRENQTNIETTNIWEVFCHLVKKPKKTRKNQKTTISGKSAARGRLQRVSENWFFWFFGFFGFLEVFLVFCRFSWLPLLCVLRAPWLQSHIWMRKQLGRSAVLNSHSLASTWQVWALWKVFGANSVNEMLPCPLRKPELSYPWSCIPLAFP